MSNVESSSRIIRSLIAGGMGMASTLTALGATGLLDNLSTGALTCVISFFVGFIIRLGIEYGVSTPPEASPPT